MVLFDSTAPSDAFHLFARDGALLGG